MMAGPVKNRIWRFAFLTFTVLAATVSHSALVAGQNLAQSASPPDAKADYTLRIAAGLVELSPKHVVSTTLYNGQFPGPLLRFKEGQCVRIDIHNDTDTPELVPWHGQMIPSDVDGASEEGPGAYDREVFLVMKEFAPSLSRGGDMAMDFLAGEAIPENPSASSKANASCSTS
jgi:hypothetical protein